MPSKNVINQDSDEEDQLKKEKGKFDYIYWKFDYIYWPV